MVVLLRRAIDWLSRFVIKVRHGVRMGYGSKVPFLKTETSGSECQEGTVAGSHRCGAKDNRMTDGWFAVVTGSSLRFLPTLPVLRRHDG